MFGERLRELRTKKGLTQTELAKALKVSASTIGMYEQGRRDPDTQTLRVLADYFDVTTDYLLGVTHDPTTYVLSGDDVPDELKKLGVQEMGVDYEVKKYGLTEEDIKEVIDYIRFKGQKKEKG